MKSLSIFIIILILISYVHKSFTLKSESLSHLSSLSKKRVVYLKSDLYNEKSLDNLEKNSVAFLTNRKIEPTTTTAAVITDQSNKILANRTIKTSEKVEEEEELDPSIILSPNFNNKGFKCAKSEPKTNRYAQLCANYGQACTSKGAVLFGPDENNSYLVVLKEKGSNVDCTKETFDLKTDKVVTNRKCFTSEIYNQIKVTKLTSIPQNKFAHRVCYNKTAFSNYKLVKQLESLDCKISSFISNNTIENDCECYELDFPKNDNQLKAFYTPIRLSRIDTNFKCIKTMSNKNDNESLCDFYGTRKSCIGAINGNIKDSSIFNLEDSLNKTAVEYYFNRWICPNESGLNVAVKYNLNKDYKTYNVNCLSRNGEDCFYEDNAKEACKRIINCPTSDKEFAELKTGDTIYSAKWGNDGFNTPMNTWGKAANAWLIFDGTVNVLKDKSKAIVLNGNGANSCIPDSVNVGKCLAENDIGILKKTINYYEEFPSNYNNLLSCGIKTFPESIGDSNHWCSRSLVSPNDKGEFSFDISELLIIDKEDK